MFLICCAGLFISGCVFQDALNGEGILLGLIPPLPSAILALVSAVGWALWMLDAAGN